MRLTLQEQRILKELAENVNPVIRPGRKAANHEQTREERRAMYRKVGDLINRYEAWLEKQD